VPKRDGYNVETIDHTDKKGLQEKYAAQGHHVADIEEVDYIWNGESYAELTGKKTYYDYIIASHIIEHTCDLVGFLRDCSDMLKENGILSLAIPDKRYCFDYLRPVTGISKAIDSHINRSAVHTPGNVYEYISKICKSGTDIAWTSPHPPVMIKPVHSIHDAKNVYNESLIQSEYIDIHNWVFTKSSFELLIYDLNCLGFIDMRIAASFDTSEHEFIVSLIKKKEPFMPDDDEHFKLAVKAHLECDPLDPEDIFLKKQLIAFEDHLAGKEARIKTLEKQLTEIYESFSWRIVNKLQKIFGIFNRKNQRVKGNK